MSLKIRYHVKQTRILGCLDAAYLSDGDDPHAVLIESIVHTIATDVEVTIGGVTMHLAAWGDPDHWSDEWDEAGIEDPDAFIASAIVAEP